MLRSLFVWVSFAGLASIGLYSAISGPRLNSNVRLQPVVVGIAQAASDPASYEEVHSLVINAVEDLFGAGGLANLVQPGDRVFIKINGNYGGKPLGYLTDPRVVRAVAEELTRIVPAAQIKVGEGISHIGSSKLTDFQNGGFDTDLDGFLDGVPGVEMVCLNEPHDSAIGSSSAFVTRFDNAPGHQRATWHIPNVVAEADVRISIPVLKAHNEAGLTAAMKNSIGLLPADIYYSGVYSRSYEVRGDVHRFYPNGPAAAIADINAIVPYDFVIIDALTAHRHGPWSSSPDRIYPRAILAATDAVAADAVTAAMVGWNPASLDYLVYAQNDSTGVMDPGYIHVRGRSVAAVRSDLALRYPGKVPFPLGYGDGTNNQLGSTAADVSAPTVTLTSPQPGELVSGIIPVKFDCGDNEAVARVELQVDQAIVASVPYPAASDSLAWDTTDAEAGPHILSLRVYDAAFNESSAEAAVIVEDATSGNASVHLY